MQVRANQGDTLELLCWRYLNTTSGIVEQALELNPKLAEYGPVLPHGHLVTLPELTTKIKIQPMIQLWD